MKMISGFAPQPEAMLTPPQLTWICLYQGCPFIHLVQVEAVQVAEGDLAVTSLKHATIEVEAAMLHSQHGVGAGARLHRRAARLLRALVLIRLWLSNQAWGTEHLLNGDHSPVLCDHLSDHL